MFFFVCKKIKIPESIFKLIFLFLKIFNNYEFYNYKK